MLPEANAAISSADCQTTVSSTLRFACSKYPLSMAIISGAAIRTGW